MSDNVFADLGLPLPEEELTKAQIVSLLRAVITEKNLSDAEAAGRLELSPSALSALLRGQWQDFSIDRLLRCVNALNRNVRIIVDDHDVPSGEQARTLVLTA